MREQKRWSIFVYFVLGWSCVYATSEFRTPLDFMRPAYLHYPLDVVKNSWWYDYCSAEKNKVKNEGDSWQILFSTGLYGRGASKAFVASCDTVSISSDCSYKRGSTHHAPLAALWFGQSSFVAEQAFAGGMITNAQNLQEAPFLAFSTITPIFTYSEKGAWIGMRGEWRTGREQVCAIGFRASIPFKKIDIIQEYDFGANGVNGVETGLDNVYKETVINVGSSGANNQVDYAFRLDFLNALIRPSFTNPTPVLLFGTGTPPNTTQVSGNFIADNNNAANTNRPPAYIIKSSTGVLPKPAQLPANSGVYSFAKQQSQVTGSLPASGAGTDGATYYFDAMSNYAATLGANRATQATLFLVPRMNNTGGDSATGQPANLAPVANSIRNVIDELLSNLYLQSQSSALAFLTANCGIDLARSENVVGVGDFNTEFYVGFRPENKKWYVDGIVGVLFPTAKADKNPNHVYYQPTGNHKHFEGKVGLELGYKPCRYFALKGDFFYSHAFKHAERRAAPFKGATIKNIGVPVSMDVSWNAVQGHFDATIFNPYNSDLVFGVGYEGYYKGKDRIRLCGGMNGTTTAVDCLGNTQPLDPRVLEKNSNTLSHKIRAEVSHRISYFEFTLAASYVVAGRNVMQEAEVHIGTTIYF